MALSERGGGGRYTTEQWDVLKLGHSKKKKAKIHSTEDFLTKELNNLTHFPVNLKSPSTHTNTHTHTPPQAAITCINQ